MQDNLYLGDIMLSKQIFGAVTEQEGDAFEGVPFEGILGLGSAKLSVANSVTVFDNMKIQKTINK